MQFALNEDQVRFRDMAPGIRRGKNRAACDPMGRGEAFPVDVMREAAKLGHGRRLHQGRRRRSALTRSTPR